MSVSVLKVDMAGMPIKWIDLNKTVKYLFDDAVGWSLGNAATLHGGVNRITKHHTVLDIPSIIAIKNERGHHFRRAEPGLSREKLFRRDQFLCAYCGEVYMESELEMEHIYPKCRGGEETWMNLVTACTTCNRRKRNRSPEEAKMPLLYLPYVPSIWEDFLLLKRNILADQMEFLMASLPKESRLRGK